MKPRLDVLLAARHPDTSRARLQELIASGAVTVDGLVVTKPSARVDDSAQTVVHFPEPTPPADLLPLDLPLSILLEDPHLLVLDKPAGLVIHPAPGHDQDTLVNALLHHCDDLRGIGDELRPGIIHRLDRDTSGVLVVAKTEPALRALADQFAAHTTQKIYLALCWGTPAPARGLLDAPIGRSPANRQKQAIVPVEKGGRPARTRYTVLASSPHASLLALRIETGRTHQIRVHLSALLHHPICGDPLYGGRSAHAATRPFQPARQMLHALRLTFQHPATGKSITCTAPLPPDFLEALARLLPDLPPSAIPPLLEKSLPLLS